MSKEKSELVIQLSNHDKSNSDENVIVNNLREKRAVALGLTRASQA